MYREKFFNSLNIWFNEFIGWYSVLPIEAQVFVIIGILALLALAITILYYTIKGIAYLVFYILKGTYLLLKGIGYLFFKLFEGFYNLVSGKTNFQQKELIKNNNQAFKTIFCSECGRRFSEKMVQRLLNSEKAFCGNCGKEYRLNDAFVIA